MSASSGFLDRVSMPSAIGSARISTIVTMRSKGESETAVRISLAPSVRDPQNWRLKGVITMASNVDTAVMLTLSAPLPLA